MKTSFTSSLALLITFGCASAEAPPPSQPETPAPTTTQAPATAAPEPTPAPAPEPTPEELAQAQEQQRLKEDFAKLEQKNAAELARLTPEIRAEVKKLTEKTAAGIKTALGPVLKSPHREPANVERDVHRHPADTLAFLGVQPSHQVLEYGPGEGWYTELLAPALAKRGKLFVTLADPNGPTTERATLYAKRTQLKLDSLPEAYGGVQRVVIDPKQPGVTSLPDESLDVVLLFRGAHGMVNGGSLDAWLSEFHRVLKPKGILGIEQHRAAAGADPVASAKGGYLPEAFVIEQLQNAGFKLAAKSEINANPKDTKDHPKGVWSLPPSLADGETDRDKYVAIGESDRMTLKFIKGVKPAAPKPAATAPNAAAPAATAAAPAAAQAPAAAPAAAQAPAAAPAAAQAPAAAPAAAAPAAPAVAPAPAK